MDEFGGKYMIYTVTLNPSIDYTMHPKSMQTGKINRSEYESYTYGGKGINVSAMLKNLGVPSVALGFCGGYVGREIERLCYRCGIGCDFCEIQDVSRINVKINSDTESAVNGKGPFIRLEEERELVGKIEKLTSEDTLILSGSAPDSESGRLIENIISASAHTRFVADMEGDALRMACEKKPFLIKPNYDEMCDLFGERDMDEKRLASAAEELVGKGVSNVLVSLGENGALLRSDDGNFYKIRAPKTEVKSTVAAGDSMLAGFVAGYERGARFALALGTAAGSATAACDGVAEYEDVMNVFMQI